MNTIFTILFSTTLLSGLLLFIYNRFGVKYRTEKYLKFMRNVNKREVCPIYNEVRK